MQVGTAITAIALATMPVAAAMMGGGGEAGNPCGPAAAAQAENPCTSTAASAANPCNPSESPAAGSTASPANPCNPCGATTTAAGNPCNPCGDSGKAQAAANPCADPAKNPCSGAAKGAGNPCNPCGGGSDQGPWSSMISLINHLVAKGGSWFCSANYCGAYRPGFRGKSPGQRAFNNVGFRCALDGEPKERS